MLAEDLGVRALGPAFAWAEQRGAESLELIVPRRATAGVVARRATLFREPPHVWVAEGRALVPAVRVGASGDRSRSHPSSPMLIDLILDAGADPVVEHGVLAGEVAGLEVLRAVVDPYTASRGSMVGLGQPRP